MPLHGSGRQVRPIDLDDNPLEAAPSAYAADPYRYRLDGRPPAVAGCMPRASADATGCRLATRLNACSRGVTPGVTPGVKPGRTV